MKDSEWLDWLNQWLKRHPIRSDKNLSRSEYTKEVMARIRLLGRESPKSSYLRDFWDSLFRPRFALVFGSAVVVLLAGALFLFRTDANRIARLEKDIQVLASFESGQSEALMEDVIPVEVADIETYLKASDEMILAKNEIAYEQEWIEQTIELLEGVNGNGKSLEEYPFEAIPDEEIEEIRLLDQLEFPA